MKVKHFKSAQHHTLPSGLQVVLAPMGGVKSVTCLAMVGVGSRYETKKKNGLSHFVEHMVFKGSDKWPSAHDLSKAVDGIGADFNAFTGKEYTGFYIKSASAHVNLSLDMLSDMLYTSKFRKEDLEREKGVIAEEINMYNDLPQRKVGDLFDEAMYGDYGLGRRIDGTHKAIRAFERKDFMDHLKDWYGLDNTCVVVAGDESVVGGEGLLKVIEGYFKKGEKLGPTEVNKVHGFAEHGDVQVTVHTKQSDQAHFVLGFPSYPQNHADRYPLSVLSIIYGGNMSSRLFTEIREKRGLAYYSRIDVDRYADVGSIAAACGVDVNRVDEAVKVTMDVFDDVAEDGKNKVTEEELERAKEYLCGSLTLSLETSRNVAQYWAQRVTLHDEVIEPDEVLAKVRAVTREDVVRVAKDLINPEKQVFALVGPFEDGGKFSRLLRYDV